MSDNLDNVVTVRMDDDMYAELKAFADNDERSLGSTIRRIVREHLRRDASTATDG